MIEDEDLPEDQPLSGEALPTDKGLASAVDPATIKRAGDQAKREAAEAEEFWAGVFRSAVGRREMWRLLQVTHAFEERFACGPNGFPQVEATWFHAGEQAVGQRLYQTWLRRDPLSVSAMHAENDPNWPKPTKLRRAA